MRSRAALHLEVLALRHQLQVLSRSRPQRLRLAQADGLLWIWLSRVWNEWRAAVVIVKPKTVIAWHRRAFRSFWSWKRRRRIGRPSVAPDVRTLILSMSAANPQWGAPRIHGELLKLGIAVSQNNRTEAGRAAKTINSVSRPLRRFAGRCRIALRSYRIRRFSTFPLCRRLLRFGAAKGQEKGNARLHDDATRAHFRLR